MPKGALNAVDKAVEFIERLGRDARLRYAPSIDITRARGQVDLDPRVLDAILGADQERLEALLGATANVCCLVRDPDDGEGEDEEPPDEGEKET